MSLYTEFSMLLPYLQSVRKLNDYLSFDISFPNTWKIPKKFVNEERVMEQETKTPEYRLFSFVSEITEKEVGYLTDNLQNIIKYNLEREEKEMLFEKKVDELRSIFDKENLYNLKGLSFQFSKVNKKIKFEDYEDELGDEHGSEREMVTETDN